MMYIQGIGIISPSGRGLGVHRQAWASGRIPAATDGFLRVQDETLKDPLLAKEARRATRFDRMAILAGLDALTDAGQCPDAPSRTGLILATALGPHVTTLRFLDDVIRYKPEVVSPTCFSHSVHNVAAAYLSLLAGLRGPTLTVTRFTFAFHEALTVAQSWLEQKRCERVLVGAVDELGAVMERIIQSRPSFAAGPAARIPLAEGGVFFVLGAAPAGHDYGTITPWPEPAKGAKAARQLALLETNGLASRAAEPGVFGQAGAMAAPAAWFGRQACPGALSCAAAALFVTEPDFYRELKPERYLRPPTARPETCLALAQNDQGIIRTLQISESSEPPTRRAFPGQEEKRHGQHIF